MMRGLVQTLVCSVMLHACTGDEVPEPLAEMTVVTMDAGLRSGEIPGAHTRGAAIVEALRGLGADLACVQEVFRPEDVARFEALGQYSVFAFAEQEADVGCADGDLDRYVSCAGTNCSEACPEQAVACAREDCTSLFFTLPTDCLRCALAEVGSPAASLQQTCEEAPVRWAEDGVPGVGIVTDFPLLSTHQYLFESTTERRAVVHAELDVPGGAVDVFCTQLTAVDDPFPYPEASGNRVVEQTDQIGDLRAFIDDLGKERVVLLGSFDSGPVVAPAITSSNEDNWSRISVGFDAPYEGPCTACSDNPLADLPLDQQRITDNILVMGASVSVSRVLDTPLDTVSCDETLPGALSDRYGLVGTVRFSQPE